MLNQEFLKQTVAFNKAAFDNAFTIFLTLEKQIEALSGLLEQTPGISENIKAEGGSPPQLRSSQYDDEFLLSSLEGIVIRHPSPEPVFGKYIQVLSGRRGTGQDAPNVRQRNDVVRQRVHDPLLDRT
ncbi:MAG TPA: hypothetical protein PK587_06835 [Syntrophales bacterium]|nr:hypothetical protein [Syntrophales bacterium]